MQKAAMLLILKQMHYIQYPLKKSFMFVKVKLSTTNYNPQFFLVKTANGMGWSTTLLGTRGKAGWVDKLTLVSFDIYLVIKVYF